jgi:methylmalonyl-CoA/ethylmalonyl-CoA epimerase
MVKVEHIGIAVKNLVESNKLFAALLGSEPYKEEVVASEQVITSFFKTGNTKIELLEASNPESAISKFIEKRGEGIHHIAFEVDDIYKSIAELKQHGFVFLSEEPKKGADNKLICFIHPKSANGVLIELCQEIRPAE